MGVQADTATAVPDLLPGGADGFTSGDAQAGIAPTQVSPSFLNSVVTEINNAITRVGNGDVALGFNVENIAGIWGQLAQAILYRMAHAVGDAGFDDFILNAAWYRRTYGPAGATADKFRTWFRNDFSVNVEDNFVDAVCHVVVPDNSQFWVTWHVCVVRTNNVTIYRNAVIRASCRRNGGAVTVQSVTAVAGDGGLIATFDVKPGTLPGVNGNEPAAYLEVTLPVSVGNHFNISASAEAVNVTTGT